VSVSSTTPAEPIQVAPVGRKRLGRALLAIAAVGYVAILLLLPLIGIVAKALEPGIGIVRDTLAKPEVQHAFLLTGIITVITVLVTTFFGLVVAWVLVRQRFVGRSLMNAVVDLPFALSPVTVGLAAVLLFGAGGWFADYFAAQGIQVLFALPSMVLVTIFICIPFTIREVAPVLEEIGTEQEQAAWTLGAGPLQTFRRVTLPAIRWALAYGVVLTLARCLGEFGAIAVVSGRFVGKTQTLTLYVEQQFQNFNVAGAYAASFVLAFIAVVILVVMNVLRPKEEEA